jgi:hypothetical protein
VSGETLHRTDSRQLATLRAMYIRDCGNMATPYRLGSYARRHNLTIDDYGAHSQRWIRKFEDGVAMRPQYKEVRQLRLFNP